MGLMTKAPMPRVCHPHQKHSDTTETSLLDGLPRTEWVLRAGLGTSQVLEIITQQPPWVVGMGLAKIPKGSLGYGSLGWEAGQGEGSVLAIKKKQKHSACSVLSQSWLLYVLQCLSARGGQRTTWA